VPRLSATFGKFSIKQICRFIATQKCYERNDECMYNEITLLDYFSIKREKLTTDADDWRI